MLLLLAVEGDTGDVDVVEEFVVEANRVTGGEEDNDLLVEVVLDEFVEEEEAQFRRAQDVALLKRIDCSLVFFRFERDEDGISTEGDTSELFDTGGLSG